MQGYATPSFQDGLKMEINNRYFYSHRISSFLLWCREDFSLFPLPMNLVLSYSSPVLTDDRCYTLTRTVQYLILPHEFLL